MHTFHMVSLFGRTVIVKKMTFYPSTTLNSFYQGIPKGGVASFDRSAMQLKQKVLGRGPTLG